MGDEVLVLAPGHRRPTVLTGAAVALWQVIDPPTTLDGAVARVTDLLAATPPDLPARLAEAAAVLAEAGLVDAVAPGPDR